jgi:hypothetical protein
VTGGAQGAAAALPGQRSPLASRGLPVIDEEEGVAQSRGQVASSGHTLMTASASGLVKSAGEEGLRPDGLEGALEGQHVVHSPRVCDGARATHARGAADHGGGAQGSLCGQVLAGWSGRGTGGTFTERGWDGRSPLPPSQKMLQGSRLPGMPVREKHEGGHCL